MLQDFLGVSDYFETLSIKRLKSSKIIQILQLFIWIVSRKTLSYKAIYVSKTINFFVINSSSFKVETPTPWKCFRSFSKELVSETYYALHILCAVLSLVSWYVGRAIEVQYISMKASENV